MSPQILPHRRLSILLLLVLAGSTGCFRSPDKGKLSCTNRDHCPAGTECVKPAGQPTGVCAKVADAGPVGIADVPSLLDVAPADRVPAGDISTARSEGPAPVVDSPAGDLPHGILTDVLAATETPPPPDLGPDVTPDVPPQADAVPDGPLGLPDIPADIAADLAKDLLPDSPPDIPADLRPDLAPDVRPDLAPDLAPDLGPDLPVLKPLGATCTLPSDCENNFCVSGVCCNRSCTGACEECTKAAGGLCAFKSGTVCNPASDCMDAAVCPGTSGACPVRQPKSAGTFCGTVTCSGTRQSASTCDGFGNCGPRNETECSPFLCVSGSGCKKSCASNADCVQADNTFCGKNQLCQTDTACWRDSATNLLWQVDPDPTYRQFAEAQTLCANLTLCGFDDWVLPDIDQLRSVVRNCPNGQTGGACGVTTSCLDEACEASCTSCEYSDSPCYWVSGFAGPCWAYLSSSSYYSPSRGTTRVRTVSFDYGAVNACDTDDKSFVRCVRRWN